MTQRLPVERSACGGSLAPPTMAFGVIVPREAEYVCLKCRRPYRYVGNPPQLTTLVIATPHAHDDDVAQ